MQSIKKLFIESRMHDDRITKLLNQLYDAGFDDPANVFNIFPELIGIPVSFNDGETWTLSKITQKLWEKNDGSHQILEHFYHFRNDNGERAVWRTYFRSKGWKKSKSEHVVNLYQDEWNREWWQRKTPTVLLDAAERLCNKILENKK